MRIVLDLQACQATNRERGIGRYAMSLAQAIAGLSKKDGRDHDVRIVLNNAFPESVGRIRQAFEGMIEPGSIRVFDAPTGVAGSLPDSGWRMQAAERIREHTLAGLNADIVHIASPFEGWADDAVSSIGQGPAQPGVNALTLYDLIPLMRPEAYLAEERMRHWYYRKLQTVKNADLLLAISGFTRDEAISALALPAAQVVNISSAIDPAFKQRTLVPEAIAALKQRYGLTRPFVMYTGGIDPRKNIEGLIEAFAALPESYRKNYQLAIVCNIHDADRHRLLALAKRSGLSNDALVLTGYVSDADLVDLYNIAHLFVFPSFHEGFGLPVLEAMACGTPTIGSNSTSVREVLDREDASFDPKVTSAITSKMLEVLSNPDMQASLREHGLRQAQRFSWQDCATRALDAFEETHARRKHVPHVASNWEPHVEVSYRAPRKRLAWLSPLPPDRSGIADYAAGLLHDLARYYEIDAVVTSDVQEPWILSNCTLRSTEWFEANADQYDRIVYHFGNSGFHAHMFGLLARFPGIVDLHDFFLSGIVHHIDATLQPHLMAETLYASHGYPALIARHQDGQIASVWRYPASKQVLDAATGVIVHSNYARELAAQWYGPTQAQDWSVVPHSRAVPSADRTQSRTRLGLQDTDFLTCAFGLLGATKLNLELLQAWLTSPLGSDPKCKLVFVGENDPAEYGVSLTKLIARSGCADRIKITGFAPRDAYLDYLAAADMAVQLRTQSRGETSGTILDCLAYGLPTIINANGSAKELPETVLVKLPDDFSQQALIQALSDMRHDTAQAQRLALNGVDYVRTVHHPFTVGERYHMAIEQLVHQGPIARQRELVRSIVNMPSNAKPTTEDLLATASAVALNAHTPSSPRQLLVDVSELVRRDAKSGIQRVVRRVVESLLRHPPAGFRVEPVYEHDGLYRYARSFSTALLGLEAWNSIDDVIDTRPGDRFIGLDLAPNEIPRHEKTFLQWRNRGVEIFFVVYDLIPALRPDVFLPGAEINFGRWLTSVARVSDGLVCISRAVAQELHGWIAANVPDHNKPLRIDYFHLGADLSGTPITTTIKPSQQTGTVPTILMVGTLEPRKSHSQALDAMELLWAEGQTVNLVIIGKTGWMVDDLAKRLNNHPQSGKQLIWHENASDTVLLDSYAEASVLLAPSIAEGFGLPLIEAAQHGLPVIARDLPVFKEVAGDHAYYFTGESARELADALSAWLALYAAGEAPTSTDMPWLTWDASALQLVEATSSTSPYLQLD